MSDLMIGWLFTLGCTAVVLVVTYHWTERKHRERMAWIDSLEAAHWADRERALVEREVAFERRVAEWEATFGKMMADLDAGLPLPDEEEEPTPAS